MFFHLIFILFLYFIATSNPYKASIDGAKGLFQRADQGDEIAKKVLQEVADYLAIFCINICRIVDPEVIIFGGGMAHAGDRLLKSVQESMLKYTWTVYPPTIKLEIAHQVGNAGIFGAALSAQSYYLHLHPSHLKQHEETPSSSSSTNSPSNSNSASTSPSESTSLISRDMAFLGSITATGLMFLYYTRASTSPQSSTSSSDLMNTARNIFFFSHSILVGVQLFRMFLK